MSALMSDTNDANARVRTPNLIMMVFVNVVVVLVVVVVVVVVLERLVGVCVAEARNSNWLL